MVERGLLSRGSRTRPAKYHAGRKRVSRSQSALSPGKIGSLRVARDPFPIRVWRGWTDLFYKIVLSPGGKTPNGILLG